MWRSRRNGSIDGVKGRADSYEEEWFSMMQPNVTGLFLVSRIVGKTMLSRGSGKIINIGSGGGIKAAPGVICYCVSKAAVIHMTKCLALEWASTGITVNCIAPGSFDMYPNSNDASYIRMREQRAKTVPLGRLGRAEELGSLLVYLASSASDYMTGQTIIMDGGLSLA